jgi:3-carboxy-cis,cis-muconate cycloisomerase
VPTTFGLKAAGWMTGLDEAGAGLARVRLSVQLGGAAGTLAGNSVEVLAALAAELGLEEPVLPWHTLRGRIGELAGALGVAAGAVAKPARDIVLLSQTEVAEVREAVGGGSTAMPHKHNPVAAVSALACAQQAPGYVSALLAAMAQEHERAAGAWHAEWQPYSHLLQLAVSAAAWARDLLANLDVDKGRMAANLAEAGGLPLAERVTALLRDSLGAPAAHDLVAVAAARSASSGVPFRDVLLATPEIEQKLAQAGITPAQVERALDPSGYLGASDAFITAALAAHAAAPGPDNA